MKILQNLKVSQDDSQSQLRKDNIKVGKKKPRPKSSDQKLNTSKN